MPAPLYNRFCRYAQREAKRYPRHSDLQRMIPQWKRPSTSVFSLSDKAAYEAGWWSTEPPGDLLRASSLHFMPTERAWIEWNWKHMSAGSARLKNWWEDQNQLLMSQSNSGIKVMDDSAPARVGAMIRRSAFDDEHRIKDGWFDLSCPPGTFMALLTYIYPNGTFFVGPTISFWHPTETVAHLTESIVDGDRDKQTTIHMTALGTQYCERYGNKNPRLFNRLCEQSALIMIGKPDATYASMKEVEGTTRLIMSALTAVLSAKPTTYTPDDSIEPRKRKKRSGSRRAVVEVDLFIRHRSRPGASIKSSVGHQEAVKKGLHTVGAHYAYRARKDGGDPRVCDVGLGGHHSFEEVEGTNTEVCVLCGQKRWFKKAHERGDEAYGIVPRKIKNIRVGEPAE